MPRIDKSIEHGIERATVKGILRFRVAIMRRRYRIERSFSDLLYGGTEAALAAARLYRDAVLRVFPPFVNKELARCLHSNNTSGAPGIYSVFYKGNLQSWRACLVLGGKRYDQGFPLRDYKSSDAAFAAAVDAREQWIATARGKFRSNRPWTDEIAERHFSELLDRIDIDDSTKAGFMEKLEALNALFDTYYPRYLYVTVRVQPASGKRGQPLLVLTTSSPEGIKRGCEAGFYKRPFSEALLILRYKLAAILVEDYGPAICDAFIAEHETMFTEEGFTPDSGKSVQMRLRLTPSVMELADRIYASTEDDGNDVKA